MKITAFGKTGEFERGSTWLDVAGYFQQFSPLRILLARRGSKLYELPREVPDRDMEVDFLTGKDKIGSMTYQRSAIFLMIRAFYDVVKDDPDREGFNVIIDFTLGGGFYCYLTGKIKPTAELLSRVKARMEDFVRQALPFSKRSVRKDEAMNYFHEMGMVSKESLFRYRLKGHVNLYSLGDFENYFYGYMVPDTSFLTLFDLIPYAKGFVLLLPTTSSPDRLPEFRPMDKLYRVQMESSEWAKGIGVGSIGELNEMIVRGEADHLILMQEAFFEKQIGNIAMQIAVEKKKCILVAGPSSSGKTSLSKRLSIHLQALGFRPHAISVDNYFRNRELAPRDENGKYDFESIECVDLELFNHDMSALLSGETVQMPRYNFFTGEREYKGDFLRLSEGDILVIEGIHCLNDRMSASLPDSAKFRIYISALTQLNIDAHNRIPTTDGRLLRRMVRDRRTRGYSAQNTFAMWPSVRRGEEKNIFPNQEKADVMVNSSMVYELPVLKLFAVPLLFQISKDSPEFLEARRLLKFLDYVLPISPERVPQNSILREFIGGSCLDVG